jgi:hypothetical protein
MRASELIFRLQALQHHQGDLDVVVLDDHGDVIDLKTQVETERFFVGGPQVFVLEAKGF